MVGFAGKGTADNTQSWVALPCLKGGRSLNKTLYWRAIAHFRLRGFWLRRCLRADLEDWYSKRGSRAGVQTAHSPFRPSWTSQKGDWSTPARQLRAGLQFQSLLWWWEFNTETNFPGWLVGENEENGCFQRGGRS